MMPEMDGIETLHILKRLDDYYIPPIVALTANAITGMKEMYLKEGFDSYLSKPINVLELDKVIHKYFENSTKSTVKNNIKENNNELLTNVDTIEDKKTIIEEKNDIIESDKEGNETMEEFLKNNNVDLDKSLEFLGDIEMYNITILDFKTESMNKWEKIKECFDKEDMTNYSIYVHALKSDCKYLGFMKLADISYQHELKSKENDISYIKEHYNELETEFNKIKDLVNTYVSKFNLG